MSEGTGRKPDYNVGAVDKVSGFKHSRVGAAWKQGDGQISIKLNPFVVFDCTRMDIVLPLFPVEGYEERAAGRNKRKTEANDEPPPY